MPAGGAAAGVTGTTSMETIAAQQAPGSTAPATRAPLAIHRVTVRDPRPLGAAVATLQAALCELRAAPPAVRPDRPLLVRAEVAVRDVEPLAWLSAQAASPRLYWASREGASVLAGAGRCISIDGGDWAAVGEALAAAAGDGESPHPGTLRWFVTGRFTPSTHPAPEWAAFGRCRAVLPRFELAVCDGTTWLACHVVLPHGGEDGVQALDAAIAGLRHDGCDAAASNPALRPWQPVRFATRAGEEVAWRDRVARALAAIGRPARDGTGLDKVVLARMLRGLAGEERPDPLALLARLAASQPRSYCFLVEPEPGVAFVGASPERLYRRTPASVTCEALAGTRARAGSPEADAALGAELRRDPKERHEQRLVTDWIRVRLGRLCEAVTCDDEPSVVETTTLQHLRTTIRGRPREGVTDAALLDLLHPTPAVCGVPLSPARRWIEQSERFDRGLYAGPVGWMSRDASEVAVAIRSALISGREVRLYAGAGLVTGSEAEREWRETEGKMRALRALLERGGADGEGR